MPPVPASPPRFHALVPCAGSGFRAAASVAKQYVLLGGRPLVEHTLAALAEVGRLTQILVVLAADDTQFDRLVRVPTVIPCTAVRCGGATRAASVAAGLAELARRGAAASDWVLVHDAARCLVRGLWVDALIDACVDDAAGGLLAIPVADTLKREAAGRAVTTVARAGIWQAQTPQMFRLGVLSEALARFGDTATDDASAVERMGLAPLLVVGSSENMKVTQAGDFTLAAALLEARRA